MGTAEFAAFSDNAIMFASIVYVLAVLAHLVEWASTLGRSTVVATSARGAEGGVAVAEGTSTDAVERRRLRIETAGRVGIALTVVAALLHLAGVVARAFATDPARVPWGNMYEFT